MLTHSLYDSEKSKAKFEDWYDDWEISGKDNEKQFSLKLFTVLQAFLKTLQETGYSKKTMRRHKNSCHSIGGYIVDQNFRYELEEHIPSKSGVDILLENITSCVLVKRSSDHLPNI